MKRALTVLALISGVLAQSRKCCEPGQSCWPTAAELEAFRISLDPDLPRNLYRERLSDPLPSAAPISSPDDQPLYGIGRNMHALYVADPSDRSLPCFFDQENEASEYCVMALRNNPIEVFWLPELTVWPLTAQHVQNSVNFANEHDICISVAGTGHDFLNRHTRDHSMFIRTSLIKDYSFDSADPRHRDGGSARFGAGLTFHEAHKWTADDYRYIQSGWATTVGVVGWALGGGHGPNGGAVGAGVDQLVEVELVTADGSLTRATANGTETIAKDGTTSYDDDASLFWALRGGGGSAWGVVTHITYKTYPLPPEGWTRSSVVFAGSLCDNSSDRYLAAFQKWSTSLDYRWSGLSFIVSMDAEFPINLFCRAQWVVFLNYVVQGASGEGSEHDTAWRELVAMFGSDPISVEVVPSKTMWEMVQNQPTEHIIPVVWSPVGVPSVLLSRDTVLSEQYSDTLASALKACVGDPSACGERAQQYQAIPGQVGSPRSAIGETSIHPEFREAMIHMVVNASDAESIAPYYALGNASYFSESMYEMPDWKQRYWGDNYAALVEVKQRVDPNNTFWCHHCVGSDL